MISGADQHEKIAPAPFHVSPAPFSCLACTMFLSYLRSYILKKPFLMDGIMILPFRTRQGQVFMDEIDISPFHSWKEPEITRKKGGWWLKAIWRPERKSWKPAPKSWLPAPELRYSVRSFLVHLRQSLVYLFNFKSLRHAFKGNSR